MALDYLNVTEVDSALLGLANAYPALCSMITLPHVTAEGRTSRALRIGTAGTPKTKGVLFTGCMHGREWGGADICVYFAADLLEAYATGAGLKYGGKTFSVIQIRRIVEEMDVFVFPCVNPDGRHYSQTHPVADQDYDWRKNRNPTDSGGQLYRIGVDNNRNFDFVWDFHKHFSPAVTLGTDPDAFGPPASEDPAHGLYHGRAPNSEPETRNVVWLFDTYPQIGWFLDIHSYTGAVLYPWGDAPNQSFDPTKNFNNPLYDRWRGVNDLTQYGEYISKDDHYTLKGAATTVTAAIAAVRGQNYQTLQSFYLEVAGETNATYPTSGASDDYAFARFAKGLSPQPIYGFAVEFGLEPDFHPPWPEMEMIVADIDAGLLEFCLQAAFRPEPNIHLPDLVAEILVGVTNDGGGIAIVGGKPIPVPPWDPFVRDILSGLLIYGFAAGIGHQRGQALQRQALELIAEVATEQANRV
jgi:murein tripeptide amidase MpaA